MAQYMLRRLLGLIPVLLGIAFLVFMMLRLIPGDPATIMLGERSTDQQRINLRAQLGLDQPLFFNTTARAISLIRNTSALCGAH